MSDDNITKEQLRKQMECIITTLTDLEKFRESEHMIEKITHFIQASPRIKTVSSFAAMPSEVNLDKLHASLPEINFCYPKCSANGEMRLCSVRNISEMQPSYYGIREPNVLLHEQVDPESIDLFLCPAYAYTSNGERLGRGGGYYDRYLLRKRPDAITLGIVFSKQIVSHVPTEAHDFLVDRVL